MTIFVWLILISDMQKNPFLLFLISVLFLTSLDASNRQMEYLNRGLIAIKTSSGVFLSWRLLANEDKTTGFNIYRNGIKINPTPMLTSTNYTDTQGTLTSSYMIKSVLNDVETDEGNAAVSPWTTSYKTLQLNRPTRGQTEPNKTGSTGKTADGSYPKGQAYGYSPNDCSVGDVDGDGEYEIFVKWDPSNSKDNSYYGITGNVYIDCYKLNGTFLWRINLGKNIRAGAHYTQFLVYDFDGDGSAELICKTAPGTIDGKGKYVIMGDDNPLTDYRSLDTTQITGSRMLGTVLNGPEYLTLFDGKTGAELNSVSYVPLRGSLSDWGDSYGNRSDRFLACVAYLDGETPSAIYGRGYYKRATLCAWDVRDKKLVQRWLYDSGTSAVGAYGQGNHNLSVGDVDNDGKDEIIYGSCAIDDNGTVMYRTGLGHGDAMHVSDMNPDIPGLEVWAVHEETSAAYGEELHSAANGTILWGTYTGADNGRGMAGDIDSRYRGYEMWSFGSTKDCKGNVISSNRPSVNFRIYWDGDVQDELLDGTVISKWTGSGTTNLLSASEVSSCNSTKKTPCLSADILGDWREELILWETSDSSKIRIYSTTIASTNRMYTLMHDPVYRLGIAWQNTAYNQPPHLGFYIGDGFSGIPWPAMYTYKDRSETSTGIAKSNSKCVAFFISDELNLRSSETIKHVNILTLSGKTIESFNNINNSQFSFPVCSEDKLLLVKIVTSTGVETLKVFR